MFKLVQMKGTLQLLLLAIIITTKYYVNGARLPTVDDTIATNPIPTPVADAASLAGPPVIASNPISPLSAAAAAATISPSHDQPTLSFFMHDIFGGSAPSVRIVAGIIANTNSNTQNQINGNRIPFSKPNGNKKLIPNIVHLPQGNSNTLQKLLFGTITVIDDELTEGHELGSSIIGKAQGFYLASSMDGTSHTMAFTAMFHDDGDDDDDDNECDAISFFGVHRTATVESPIAVVGGTGKYENGQGYAIIETLHHTNQHTTDGIDTLLQFSVYLTH